MLKAEIASLLPVKHAFFTAEGGVSSAPYTSLNGGIQSGDKKENIYRNRLKMADFLSVKSDKFLPLKQVHGTDIISLRQGDSLWSDENAPQADGFVTDRDDIALTIATADCAPILFSSSCGKIVGAAHAGWKGAVGGVVEQSIQAMRVLGAKGIYAVIGPSIAQKSYEISEARKEEILSYIPWGEKLFVPSLKKGHFLFDLRALCATRLEQAGVKAIGHIRCDTLEDHRFFSYRRQILTGMKDTGRQISAISAVRREV